MLLQSPPVCTHLRPLPHLSSLYPFVSLSRSACWSLVLPSLGLASSSSACDRTPLRFRVTSRRAAPSLRRTRTQSKTRRSRVSRHTTGDHRLRWREPATPSSWSLCSRSLLWLSFCSSLSCRVSQPRCDHGGEAQAHWLVPLNLFAPRSQRKAAGLPAGGCCIFMYTHARRSTIYTTYQIFDLMISKRRRPARTRILKASEQSEV